MSKKHILHPEEEVLHLTPLMAQLLKIAIETHERRDMVDVDGIRFDPAENLGSYRNVKITFAPQRLASLYALFVEAGRLYQYLKPDEKPYLSQHPKLNSND